tara:strand:- start:8029 stop:8358 length:330 start_codon:yes stop_codon:yes gene_type:complete
MATYFKNKVLKNIGLIKQIALTSDPATNATVIGLSLTNLTEFAVRANVLIQDDTSIEGYYLKDVMIPPNSRIKVLEGGEKLIIPSNNTLLVQSDLDDSLDAVISYVDIV